MKKHIIFVTINRSFFKYLVAMLNSMSVNYPDYPEVVVSAHEDVTEEQLSLLKSYPRITVTRPQESGLVNNAISQRDIKSRFDNDSFLETKYEALKLWSSQYDRYDSILMMDTDMLILKPLTSLFDHRAFSIVDALNATPNRTLTQPKKISLSYWKLRRLLKKDNISISGMSGNAGMFLLPNFCRGEDEYSKLLKIAERYKEYIWSDQSIINLWMFQEKIGVSRDYRFNFQARFYNLLERGSDSVFSLDSESRGLIESAKEDIHILHFNGYKPDEEEFLTFDWTEGRQDLIELYNYYYNNGKPMTVAV